MKKIITLLSCMLICISAVFGQKELYTPKPAKKVAAKQNLNRPQIQRNKKHADAKDFVFDARLSTQEAAPVKTNTSDVFYPYYVTQNSWFTWYDIDYGQTQFCEVEIVKEEFEIKEATIFLFDNDLKAQSSIKIENLPGPSNIYIDSERTGEYFTVRFFINLEPVTWLMNNQGEVVLELEDAFFVGNDELMQLVEKEEGVYGYEIYDLTTLQKREDVFIPFPDAMTTPQSEFYSFMYYYLDGKEYLVISTFQGIIAIEDFEDPNVFNPGPDCKLNIYMYDPADNYNLAKEISIPLESTFDRVTVEEAEAGHGAFGIHIIEFGTAAVPFEWTISTHKFNDDDKIEILFNVDKEVYVGGESTRKYIVANEDGEILKTYKPEHYVANVSLNSIIGEKDEMMIVSLNNQGEQQIEIVDVETFTTKFIIPLTIDDKLLSTNIRRKKDAAEILYMINIPGPDVTESEGKYESKGHVFIINSNLEVVEDIVFDLTFDESYYAVNFSAALTSLIDQRTLFDADDAIDYMYGADYYQVIEGQENPVQTGNRFYIGKANEKPFFAPYNDQDFVDTYGKYYETNFITDNLTGRIKYMYLLSNNSPYTVIYELPLIKAEVGVENNTVDNDNNIFASYSASSKTVTIAQEISAIRVFDINGALLYSGYNRVIPATNWSNGVYMLEGTKASGEKVFNKILVY